MSFDDIAAKLRERRASQEGSKENKPYDFAESYRIRGKMLGVLLRDARLAAARTIEDCARLLRVESGFIEAWEYGDAVPSLPQLELLAYYLDVPVSHFWGTETIHGQRSLKQDDQPQFILVRNRMIGALLRQAREEAEVSQEDLAEVAGLPAERIASYELGEHEIPMSELSVLASGVRKNIAYFMESDSLIGELLAQRESWRHFTELPEDLRAFAADPVNIGFIQIALMLRQMPADRLRQVGASILDITM
jgi:transcriptional regulator with XRE-family HTH domain